MLLIARLIVAVGLGLLTTSPTMGQSFPRKQIDLVTSSTPGGPPDIIARLIADAVRQTNGWNVVVQNRTGGGGTIAAQSVAKAAPDGYTIFLSDTGPLAVNPALDSKLAYDPVRDFSPVIQLASLANYLTVNTKLPVHSLKEFIDYARANPELKYGSAGVGSVPHLMMALLDSMANLNMVHVPYRGSGASVPALAAGEIVVLFSGYPNVQNLISAGTARVLANSGATRSKGYPEIPTVAEAGLPGYEMIGTMGIVAPAHTPPEIVKQLNATFSAAAQLPSVNDRLVASGFDVTPSSPEQYAALIKAEMVKIKGIVDKAQIQSQ